MNRHPISTTDRETLIAQAVSAAQCWFIVCAGAVLTTVASLIHMA